MLSSNARYWVLFVLLMCAAGLSVLHLVAAENVEKALNLGSAIPMEVGAWKGRDLKIHQGTRDLLGVDNVLFRVYEQAGRSITLCITFSGGKHRNTHPPEICYQGQGWEVIQNKKVDFRLIGPEPAVKEVTHMRVTRDSDTLEVLVWYRMPSLETASYLHQKFESIIKGFFGGARWATMVRLSTASTSDHDAAALQALADFGGCLQIDLDRMVQELEKP